MKFKEYFADRIFSLVCFMAAELIFLGMAWLIEIPVLMGIFMGGIFLLAFCSSFLWDFYRRKKYYDRLFALSDQLDEKTLLMEIAERPDFLDGQILTQLLRTNSKYENDRIDKMEEHSRDYREFIDAWVHEIKTPITSARLIVENEKNVVTLRIDDELRKIDHLVELVLYYARSSQTEKDFKVEPTTLQTLVNAAVKNYSKAIIQAKGRLKMDLPQISFCADVKSCTFVIGQILSNAIKYRREDFQLTFSGKVEKNEICLYIQDNGIGIDAADLPRVFDKGFTGENGRRFPKSTGIGLYLCRKLCDSMNIKLTIKSEKDRGTIVALHFPAESLVSLF